MIAIKRVPLCVSELRLSTYVGGFRWGGHSCVIVVSCQWMCARVHMCVLYTTTGLYSNIPLHLWADQAELSLLYTSKRGESSTCFMRPLESAAQWVLRISTGAAWRPAAPYNNRAVVTSAVLAHTLKTIAKANKYISEAHQNKWKRGRREKVEEPSSDLTPKWVSSASIPRPVEPVQRWWSQGRVMSFEITAFFF